MNIPHTAECQDQHFPVFALFLIDFRYRKFNLCIVSAHFGLERNAVPDHKSETSLSTFLSAIHCHLTLESLMISCSLAAVCATAHDITQRDQK